MQAPQAQLLQYADSRYVTQLPDEAGQHVEVRTASLDRDGLYVEGTQCVRRTVRNIVAHSNVTKVFLNMHMQVGEISFKGKTARVLRWATGSDDDGAVVSSTWQTQGVLCNGEYVEARARWEE